MSSNYTESPLKDKKLLDDVKESISEYPEEMQKELKKKAFENEEIEESKLILKPEEVLNVTKHLKNFELIEDVASLKGSQYTTILKEVHKTLVSLAVPEHLRIIRIGDLKTDMRNHLVCVLPSGKGKKNISETLKQIYKTFKPEANIKEPRTIHYQHMIGKMLCRKEETIIGEKKNGEPKVKKEDKWIPKYGFLNSDLLILEEAYELFNSQEKNEVDCRDAVLVAMDMWGENLVMKLSMDNLDTKEETLSYNPYVTLAAYLQPLKMNESWITKGLSRRVSTCYRNFPERTKLDNYLSKLIASRDPFESRNKFSNYMREINSLKTEWKLEGSAFETFALCHAALLEQGFRQGGKIAHYTRILEWPMQNILLKFSALNAISDLRTNITKQDVENAYVDILERLVFEFIYVEDKIKGTLDYGEQWNGATGKAQECLKFLVENQAFDRKSSIPIYQLQEVISEKYGISTRRARDKYNTMKKEGLICDYRGQGKDNGVWLGFEYSDKNLQEDEDELYNPRTLYFNILDRTDRSDRTLKTDWRVRNKSKLPPYIYNIDDKTTPRDTKNQPEKSCIENVQPKKSKNTPLGVRSVLSVRSGEKNKKNDKSTRDLQYWEDSVSSDISVLSETQKQEVLDYIKSNSKYTLPELLGKFGPGVLKLKEEGLFK